jgi:tyrosyl-tRNA synthetase
LREARDSDPISHIPYLTSHILYLTSHIAHPMSKDIDEQLEIIRRGAEEIIPEDELIAKLKRHGENGKPLRVKLGLDPTAPDIHIGFAVVLRKLRKFQDVGHTAVIIIGDFTAFIGDPSGRSKTRVQLSREEIGRNAQTYVDQLSAILDPKKTEVRFNSEWLDPLKFEDIVRMTSKMTVARVLERDDFTMRWDKGLPIGLHELLYCMAQAYDSVATQADIELGGTDQKFNLLVGRDLMREMGMEPQVCMTMPLLVGLDGVEKMSKSLGNYIGITEPPATIYGKVMSITDDMMRDYFVLATEVPLSEVEGLLREAAMGTMNPKEVKMRLAREVVAMYYGSEAASEAEAQFERVFSARRAPEEMPLFLLPADKLDEGKINAVDLVADSGLTSSRSEAKRMIDQGAATLDGVKIVTLGPLVAPADGSVLRIGRRKFARLRIGKSEKGVEECRDTQET